MNEMAGLTPDRPADGSDDVETAATLSRARERYLASKAAHVQISRPCPSPNIRQSGPFISTRPGGFWAAKGSRNPAGQKQGILPLNPGPASTATSDTSTVDMLMLETSSLALWGAVLL